jgi:hypothetical protein
MKIGGGEVGGCSVSSGRTGGAKANAKILVRVTVIGVGLAVADCGIMGTTLTMSETAVGVTHVAMIVR